MGKNIDTFIDFIIKKNTTAIAKQTGNQVRIELKKLLFKDKQCRCPINSLDALIKIIPNSKLKSAATKIFGNSFVQKHLNTKINQPLAKQLIEKLSTITENLTHERLLLAYHNYTEADIKQWRRKNNIKPLHQEFTGNKIIKLLSLLLEQSTPKKSKLSLRRLNPIKRLILGNKNLLLQHINNLAVPTLKKSLRKSIMDTVKQNFFIKILPKKFTNGIDQQTTRMIDRLIPNQLIKVSEIPHNNNDLITQLKDLFKHPLADLQQGIKSGTKVLLNKLNSLDIKHNAKKIGSRLAKKIPKKSLKKPFHKLPYRIRKKLSAINTKGKNPNPPRKILIKLNKYKAKLKSKKLPRPIIEFPRLNKIRKKLLSKSNKKIITPAKKKKTATAPLFVDLTIKGAKRPYIIANSKYNSQPKFTDAINREINKIHARETCIKFIIDHPKITKEIYRLQKTLIQLRFKEKKSNTALHKILNKKLLAIVKANKNLAPHSAYINRQMYDVTIQQQNHFYLSDRFWRAITNPKKIKSEGLIIAKKHQNKLSIQQVNHRDKIAKPLLGISKVSKQAAINVTLETLSTKQQDLALAQMIKYARKYATNKKIIINNCRHNPQIALQLYIIAKSQRLLPEFNSKDGTKLAVSKFVNSKHFNLKNRKLIKIYKTIIEKSLSPDTILHKVYKWAS
jgi:hypothetical protein